MHPYKHKPLASVISILACSLMVGSNFVNAALIAGQNFDALDSSNTFTNDALVSGSLLTNAGSFYTGDQGLNFSTTWTATRSNALGPREGNESGDFIGVNSFSLGGAPDVAADGSPVNEATQKNFQFNDGDGLLSLRFDAVDVSGASQRALTFDYWINDTGFESNDAFFATLSDGSNTATLFSFGEPELEANVSADNGSANWKTAVVDLEPLLAANGGSLGDSLALTIGVDTNSGSENVFIDNVAFQSDFVVPPPPPPVATLTDISAIQGSGAISELAGQEVATTGVVTAIDSNGFYLQDPVGDGDPATSEGIFVFTGSAPEVSVGDAVQVSGEVFERYLDGFDAPDDPGDSSITQIQAADVSVTGSGSITPTPLVPPVNGVANGVEYFESLEGMLVTATDVSAIAPTSRFGEVYAVTGAGDAPTTLNASGGLTISEDDFNPERIQIDPDSGVSPFIAALNDVETGDSLSDVTGVVSYAFGNYELIPTEEFSILEKSANTPEVTTLRSGEDTLTVASYNVLNLDPSDVDQIAAIASQIVNNLLSPDVIGLQEIQDNTGPDGGDGVTAADQTLQALIDAIAAAGGPTYEFIDNTFIGDGTSGGQPGANIRTAFLFDPSRVSVDPDSAFSIAEDGSRRTDTAAPTFFDGRPPLGAVFTFNGEEITLINNHFSSKGGSAELMGTLQPFEALQSDPSVNGSVDARFSQAQALADFVASLLNSEPSANIAVLGDLNEFQFAEALQALLADLVDLGAMLDPAERYSFIFDGNSQQLDHIFATQGLAGNAMLDIVNINTNFSFQASDHDPVLAAFRFDARAVPAPAATWLIALGFVVLLTRRLGRRRIA